MKPPIGTGCQSLILEPDPGLAASRGSPLNAANEAQALCLLPAPGLHKRILRRAGVFAAATSNKCHCVRTTNIPEALDPTFFRFILSVFFVGAGRFAVFLRFISPIFPCRSVANRPAYANEAGLVCSTLLDDAVCLDSHSLVNHYRFVLCVNRRLASPPFCRNARVRGFVLDTGLRHGTERPVRQTAAGDSRKSADADHCQPSR